MTLRKTSLILRVLTWPEVFNIKKRNQTNILDKREKERSCKNEEDEQKIEN
jgi:hypothetical protein